jgi:hypothetical protein
MSAHYNNVRSFSFFFFSFLVSTTNTTTPTVQPLVRSNNNIRQPAIVQRQHYSSPTSPSHAITATTYREARPTTAVMMTTIESTRY